ncbi:dihydrofolate reductase family protein [Streptomyces sp. NPDC020681]|uniref:dihydrofolate reductase family protein n=1 Tax=Streptomyces sp. NPDC020681 TaxID=3365083 RepID=UPI00378A39A1
MTGQVFAQISVSLDGFLAGPDAGVEHPLGIGGERLHQWAFGLRSWRQRQGIKGGEDNRDSRALDELWARTGAVVMGRRMFDSGEVPWGPNPPFRAPVFVVTSRDRETLVREGGTSFVFVTDGIESALAQARAAAGDKDVSLAGGADVIQQFIRAGLLDELEVHVVPVLMGAGTRLFDHLGSEPIEWQKTEVVDAPEATHIRLRAVKAAG